MSSILGDLYFYNSQKTMKYRQYIVREDAQCSLQNEREVDERPDIVADLRGLWMERSDLTHVPVHRISL